MRPEKFKKCFTNFCLIIVDVMEKGSVCPGCRHKFKNGRPYSLHIKSCKDIDSAVNMALKKHKILTAKRTEEKKAAIAARKELAAQRSEADGPMDVDIHHDLEVRYRISTLFFSYFTSFPG